jgi:hypothetical protein
MCTMVVLCISFCYCRYNDSLIPELIMLQISRGTESEIFPVHSLQWLYEYYVSHSVTADIMTLLFQN